MPHRLAEIFRREQRMLVVLGAGAALVFAFLKLAGEMAEGETTAFDRAITLSLRQPENTAIPVGPHWLLSAMTDITALGGTTVLTLITVLAVVFLLLRGRGRQAALTAVATTGGALFGAALKTLFARPRPEIVPHLVEVTSLSFPSGHSMNSAIIYFTLAVLVARSFHERATRIFILSVAAILVLLIGISRVYLGVHFPTDVLGGWTVGAAWALAMGAIAGKLQDKRQIEQPSATPG